MPLVCYETVYLLKPELAEDLLVKTIDKYQGILLEQGAKNIVIENKGRRHLKYPIKKFKDGVYIQMLYFANGEVVELVEKSLSVNESVLRYLTIKIPAIKFKK